ncbi:endonuclease/exonuclease/phosphatase family protein [Rubellimicrobium arenae]|uniref:endonuclease/exonuclease/phosphatase family protein n=1 Tax=Rubellimicrobium arenae TaxID=2817372 RepID=UPI001FEDBA1B|nr:endonuclease/exonuclease/phosphatase family protein [Rubellimicrobium arenae]
MRLATWGADLSRAGPGLLLRDLLKGEDPAIAGVISTLAAVRPDILLLTDMDWDGDGAALSSLADRLAEQGLAYPYRMALPSNAGLASGLDLDGDGRLGGPGDAQGYGHFAGEGGLALLSRWPLGEMRDLSGLLWRDLPGARLPRMDGHPFPSDAAQAIQRLSSSGHWIVPVETPAGRVTLLAWSATPPIHDGPERRNSLRNADELAVWLRLLDGDLGPVPEGAVVIGNANLDPMDGAGLRDDMLKVLADPRLQDPLPRSEGARADADPGQVGDPALDTVDWPGGSEGPGNLRVTYILPAATWHVIGSGVVWPRPGEPLAEAVQAAGPHRLVWVELDR